MVAGAAVVAVVLSSSPQAATISVNTVSSARSVNQRLLIIRSCSHLCRVAPLPFTLATRSGGVQWYFTAHVTITPQIPSTPAWTRRLAPQSD